MTTSKQSVTEIIANRFIAELEKGVAPWARGFSIVAPQNCASKKAYRGVNYFLLSMLGVDYALTFNQAKAMGGSVKKGAKGLPIVFWNFSEKTDKVTGDVRKVPFMRYYTVFSLSDTEGVNFTPPARNDFTKVPSAEEVFEKIKTVCGFTVNEGGNQPSFTPATNSISMPPADRWESAARYYKTLFHECGHALGKVTGKEFKFAGEGYATEELVAELFAASVLGMIGVDCASAWDNSVAYLQGWISKLQNDPQAIISAAQEAQKRLDLVFPPASAEGEDKAGGVVE